jgi:hypothetical protein
MAWVDYQRKPTGLSGKYGESLRCPERWQIRVDSPLTSKAEILGGVTAEIGITWGSPHWEFPGLLAQEFDLQPESDDGMRWMLTVQFYSPPPGKKITENGIPEDVWERSGGTTSVPAFTDIDGEMIVNSAGDPLEGLEREREETSWSLTKYYADETDLDDDIEAAAGALNQTEWANQDAKTWKCYFKGSKKQTISRLDGDDDGGKLEFIESRWEFRLEPDTWKAKPWDVGFMELIDGGSGSGSGERRAIVGSDGKAVKQPVALMSDGTAKPAGEPPDVINGGAGVDLYPTADFDTIFGTPRQLPDGS